MSRIQQILDKAEREGRMRRTTGLDQAPEPGSAEPSQAAPVLPSPVGTAPAPPAPPAPPPAAAVRGAAGPPASASVRAAAPPPAANRTYEPPPRIASSASRSAASPATSPSAPVAPPLRPVTAVASPVTEPARAAEARLNRVLVAALQPHSTVAEQYRALRTRIAQLEHDRYFRAILVTSPAQGDGKSVTALNLALAMAQEFHRRVLLIDTDFRNPSLHRLVGIPARPGLTDVLLGEATPEEAMVSLPDCRMTVIAAGSPVDRPTELLGSSEMRRLVDSLRTQFDRIVFDTPPAAPLADVGVLAPLVDGVLMVVRAGRTQRPAIDRALEDIDPSRLLGLVLNDVEEPVIGYAYGGQDAPAKAGKRARPVPIRPNDGLSRAR